jgi:hypothetical protein
MERDATATVIGTASRMLLALLVLAGAATAEAQMTLTRGTNFSVDVAADGRVAMNLLDRLWLLPPRGGEALAIHEAGSDVQRPRWSPDGSALVYQRRGGGQARIWVYELAGNAATMIGSGRYFDQHPDWHPDGDRIVYSSVRRESGFDLWELDLATGLTWRISFLPGDETEPAWSADGRDLVYVYRENDTWFLMLRSRGQPDRILEQSDSRLSSPAWRPDGSLVTFMRHDEDGLSVDMVILSDPLLIRPLIAGEDIFIGAVAWRDRLHMLYTSNGLIRTRHFNAWKSRSLPFRATLTPVKARVPSAPRSRQLPAIDEPSGKIVIRAARLFDGVGDTYRDAVDILIDGGRITAVEEQRDRPDMIVVDMADLTVLPGYIDSHGRLPADTDGALGPVLLSFGLTTVVADHPDAASLDSLWAGKAMPGPRVLGADWIPDLPPLPSIVLGVDALPVSPAGIRYEDAQVSADGEPSMLVSALADARTGGMSGLLAVRQAGLLGVNPSTIRRFVAKPGLDALAPPIVLGSYANGLPPGMALHAEFRALTEAGLSPRQVLGTAGVNASTALGLGLRLGRVAPGASADLVVVDGDPLADIAATLNVVGVVRNGRFYSAIGLLDRAEQARVVE